MVSQHVRWLPDNVQSRVDYAALKRDRRDLNQVLAGLSAVSPGEFNTFTRDQRMAFLINAYNAFTLELILTKYPDLESIRDLGSILKSPWKQEFFTLLGARRSLDWVEHDQLRAKFRDPRIHAAVNCASVGCPALRNEAFTAERLDAQLDDGMERFLRDRTRNRYRAGRLEVNPIFDWYGGDFANGNGGYNDIRDLFARYAVVLTDDPAGRQALRARKVKPEFLDYDWRLNDLPRPPRR